MAVMNWLSNLANPDVSERNAKLFQDSRRSGTDYMAALAGVKKTGAETRGVNIGNEKSRLGLDQQKILNSLFAKHFDPATQKLRAEDFSKDAIAAGILSPEAVQTPMSTSAGQLATGAKMAGDANLIRTYAPPESLEKLTAPPESKKPSGAPASPTTSSPKQSLEGFVGSLAGMPQEPPAYDPSADVETVAKTFDTLPPDRKSMATKRLTEMGAPDIRTAANNEAQRFLGPKPKPTDFPGEPAKYKAAMLEYTNKGLGVRAHLQDFSGGLVPAGLATSTGIQSKNQNATKFENDQDAINFYRSKGLAVSDRNVEKVGDLFARKEVLESAQTEASHIESKISKGEMKPDTFAAEVAPLSQALAYSEDVRTESGAERLFSIFRNSKSFGAIASSAHGPMDLLQSAARNAVSAQSQREYLSLVKMTTQALLRSGITASQIKAIPRIKGGEPTAGKKPYSRGVVE